MMEIENIKNKLNQVFIRVFNDPQLMIQEYMTANDINQWDSLTHMILISEIEKEFGIKFKLKDLNNMANIGKMITIIQSKILS